MEEEYYPDDIETEKDYDYSNDADEVMQGEASTHSSSVDRIFNTEEFLKTVEKTLLGWKLADGEWKPPRGGTQPVATTGTIMLIINTMRSTINAFSLLSNKSEDEINYHMQEINRAIAFYIYDDPEVEDKDVEYIINLIDHSVNMFMGIVKYGEGSEAVRQLLTGNYMRLTENQTSEEPYFRLGTKDKNIMSFGGGRK